MIYSSSTKLHLILTLDDVEINILTLKDMISIHLFLPMSSPSPFPWAAWVISNISNHDRVDIKEPLIQQQKLTFLKWMDSWILLVKTNYILGTPLFSSSFAKPSHTTMYISLYIEILDCIKQQKYFHVKNNDFFLARNKGK